MLIGYDERYLSACADIYLKTFRAEPFGYDWLTEDAALRYFADTARCPGFLGYILLADGRPEGACLGRADGYSRGVLYEIKEFFVEPGSQNKGLGREFLSDIEKDLTNRGVSCITLLTQRGIRAHGFYLRNGFAESAGAVVMAKAL